MKKKCNCKKQRTDYMTNELPVVINAMQVPGVENYAGCNLHLVIHRLRRGFVSLYEYHDSFGFNIEFPKDCDTSTLDDTIEGSLEKLLEALKTAGLAGNERSNRSDGEKSSADM